MTPVNPRAIRQRFLAPPMDILCRQLGEDDLPLTRMLKSANPANHALFSGCRDNQTSADAYISGSYNGAFTYYFCKHIRDAQGAISRAELLKRLRASSKARRLRPGAPTGMPGRMKKKKLLE